MGAVCVQVNLHHVRGLELEELEALASARTGARPRDPRLGRLPRARTGRATSPRSGSAASRRGSSAPARSGARCCASSPGFYRADLAGRPELVEAERTVRLRRPSRRGAGRRGRGRDAPPREPLRLHGLRVRGDRRRDGSARVGVFLDLINPVAALENPVAVVERLAPLAHAGHVKDYVFRSIPTDDGYHRRGFEVLYRYPGEGVADLPAPGRSAPPRRGGANLLPDRSKASTTEPTSPTSASGSTPAWRACGSWPHEGGRLHRGRWQRGRPGRGAAGSGAERGGGRRPSAVRRAQPRRPRAAGRLLPGAAGEPAGHPRPRSRRRRRDVRRARERVAAGRPRLRARRRRRAGRPRARARALPRAGSRPARTTARRRRCRRPSSPPTTPSGARQG